MRNHTEIIQLSPTEEILYEEMSNNFKDAQGLTKVLPWASWRQYPDAVIKQYCVANSIWVIPTEELIDFIADQLSDEDVALEVGCGMGIIGRELGFILTDSKLHGTNIVPYKIPYPDDIEELDAVAAAEKYKPHTILACHCVPLWTEKASIEFFNKYHRDASGSIYGVDYRKLLKNCKQLIAIAHDDIMDLCNIMSIKHRTLSNLGIFNRSLKSLTIYLWKK